MGNLALSSLIIFCLLLPGIVFDYRYSRRASSWELSRGIMITTVRALTWGVIFGVPVHALWLVIVEVLSTFELIPGVDYGFVFGLLVGSELTLDQLSAITPVALASFGAYVISQVFFGAWAGSTAARWLENSSWSQSVALASPSAMWFRLLSMPEERIKVYEQEDVIEVESEPPDGIVLSLTVSLGDTTYLYYGLLWDYALEPDTGRLQRVVLQFCSRRDISADRGEGVYEMPGEFMVIECDNVQTFDVDYFWIDEDDQDDEEPDRTATEGE